MIKTIVLDIEGTITTPSGSAGKSINNLQKTLQSLEARGITIILCSGRSVDYILEFKKQWGLRNSSPVIAENGCVIFEGNSEIITFDTTKFDHIDIMDKLSKTNIYDLAEADPAKKFAVTFYPIGFLDGLEVKQDSVFKIFELIKPIFIDSGLSILFTSCSVEILPEGVDKLHGLKALIQHIPSINFHHTLYVGDSKNDLEIGKYVRASGGIFCVPANALAELKSKANYTASKPYDEGVLEILDRYDFD